ncbi:MAG: integrase core domain-containing protein [Candidatus Zixiibacteriota bacterium]
MGIHQAFTSYNNPKGNAVTERMMRALKEELIWLREWRDPHELSAALDQWIETYNETWLHSALGYRTPNRVEETYNLTTRTLLENAG